MRALLDAGVRVGLGVDGTASNERGDLFGEVKQALLVARGRDGATALTAREALRLATRGGAEVLRRGDTGPLEPGRRGDGPVGPPDFLELGGAVSSQTSFFRDRIASTGSSSVGARSCGAAHS